MKKRLLSLLLCLSMIMQFVPTMAMATDGVQICTHHVHDDSCGYAEAVDGAPCAHVHDEICGYAEGTEEVLCACTTTDESGMLLHEEGCGYLPAVPASDCTHAHDEVCGYAEMIPGQPCTFHCDECLGHDHGEEEILPPKEIEPPVVEPEKSAPECTCESEDPEWHAPFCDAYVAPEKPECFCVELCGEAGINEYCDICWFDPEACAASGEEQAAEFATTPTYIASIGIAQADGANACKNKLSGHTIIDVDLNRDAKGDYVYMGYKTTTDPSKAITGIVFRVGQNPPARITYGGKDFYLVGGTGETNTASSGGYIDLNAKAGGDYIYAYVTRDRSYGAPLTTMTVNTSSSYSGYSTGTNTSGNVIDLNQDAGGDYLYLHYKRFSATVSSTYYYLTSSGARTSSTQSGTVKDHQEAMTKKPSYSTSVTYDGRTFTFKGWREDNTAGSATVTSPSATYMTGNKTYRAVYAGDVTLSFDANGGSGAPSAQKGTQYINAGTSSISKNSVSITIPSATLVHAAKCSFLGWATDSGAASATSKAGDKVSIDKNTTLYAVYKNHTMSGNICTNCGYSNAVPGQVNGVYQIGNKAQLIWFMQHVNAGNRSANAELTADIDMGGINWTPIASTPSYHATAITDWGYEGTFDGNGHVISNFKVVCENGDGSSTAGGNVKSYGLFGTVSGTIKNLGIDSFTFDGDKAGMADCRAGGIVGQLLSGGTVENCYTIHSSIRTDGRIAGGIAGCSYGGTIRNCFAYGNTVTGHSRCAAIVGDTVTDSGAPTKYTGTVTNCYADKNPVGSQNGGSSYVKNCATLTAAQFKSGEAAYKLGEAWGQTIGSDDLPVPGGKTVYRSDRCTGLAYSNSDDPLEEGGHYYGNKGVCEYCNRYIANAVAVLSKNGKNVFAGATLDDVITEAEKCAAGDKAVVTILQDIDLGTEKYQLIESGVFTIDLNGCKISYDHVNYSTLRINNAGTDITLISSQPGGTVENRRNNGRAIMTGRNTNLTATGITVITGNEGYAIYLNGNATLTDVTIQACEDGIHIQNTAKEHDVTLICTNCTVQATKTAVFISDDCTATITGGSLTGKEFDIIPAGSVTVAGTTFPGGIQIQSAYRGLNEILAEGYAYWAGDTMLSVADKVGSINGKGDITVKAACTHQQGEKKYVNNGGDHTYTWSCCNLAVTEGHTFTNTKCVCGARDHDCQYTNGICSIIKGCYQPAEKDENGVYLIGNAGQLYWFAQQVNLEGEVNAKARLTADIDLENRTWYPIGVFNDEAAEGTTAVKQYQGTFDGDGHTVSNFKAIGTGSQGLIGYSNITAVVKNVGVINATVSGWNAGAVLAYMGTVENCYAIDCKVTAATTAANVIRVHAGAVAGTQLATVKNCFAYNCEVLAGEGWEEKSALAPVGGKSAENCYYAEGTTNHTFRTSEDEIAVSSAQMASGEVAYKLQGEQTEQVWGQTIPGDRLPVLGGAKVYQVKDCIGAGTAYRNINEDYTEHVPGENGFCFICGAKLYVNGFAQDGSYQPAEQDENGVYLIGNAGQLYWFAQKINGGNNREINGRLIADIDLNPGYIFNRDGTYTGGDAPRTWTPISQDALDSRAYLGNFDGDHHTVSGLYINGDREYAGLFGYISKGAVVQNVGVVNAYISGTTYSGGIVARAYSATVKNCYNVGTVIGNSNYVGGIVGVNSLGTVKNCYNVGTVIGNSNYVGGIVGWDRGTVINSYYLDSCGAAGNGTAMRAEQFASGEVAYLLGAAFGQTIPDETLPVLGGKEVYCNAYCTGTLYSNSEEQLEEGGHRFDTDGFCIYCGCQSDGTLVVKHTVSSDLAADMAMSFRYTVALDNGKTHTFELKDGESSEPLEIPGGTGYEITWEAVEGFTVTGSAEGTIVAKQETTATIRWTREEANLIIEAYAESLQNTSFTFTVTLADSTISGTYGHLTFDNGVSTFTLKHGESNIGANLPAGIGYTVTTTASDETYIITKAEDNGTIKVGGSTVVFTFSCNHYFDPNNNYQCANCGTQAVAGVTIGGTTKAYLSLDAAIAEVKDCIAEDNAVVTLLTDMERSEVLAITGGVFTLDLNGKTLTGTDPRRFLTITGGTVTIADSSENETGVISSSGISVIVGGGIVNITGGKINGAIHGVQVNSGTVNISGGTISGGGSGVYATSEGIANITDGSTISGSTHGVEVSGGTTNISGGTISGGTNGVYVSGGTANITGGTISGSQCGIYIFYNATANISGGSIYGGSWDIAGSGTVLLTLAEGKTEGASFPGGIWVVGTTLQAILGDGTAYWQNDKQLVIADDATAIGGDVVIKAACVHSGSIDDGDCTTAVICSVCGLEIVPAMEDHTYSESNYKCGNAGCTYAYVIVFAVDSANGGTLVGTTLQILDAEGKVCAEWQSHRQARVDGLRTGVEYTLRVTQAPAGYQRPNYDHSFVIDDAGKVTYTGSFNEKGYLLAELNAYEVLCGTDENNLTYSNLAEALADSTKTYIRLNKDVDVDTLLLQSGRTLDLNGYTVSAGRVVVFSGSHIIDTQNGKGRLDVDADKILLPETNSYLPIKTQHGYAFIALTTSDFNEDLQMEGDNPKYAFQPLFKDDAIHSLLMAADSGVEMEIWVDWSKDDLSGTYQFVYNRDMMENFLDSYNAETARYGKMFTIKLNNTEGFDSLEMYAVVSSDLGVHIHANGRSVVTYISIME